MLIILLQLCLVHLGARGEVHMPKAPPGTHVKAQGKVYHIEKKEKHQVLYIRDTTLYAGKERLEANDIIVYDKQHIKTSLGNSIVATGEIYFFQSARNPGNFNQSEYYQRKNVSCFISAKTCEVEDETLWKIRSAMLAFREKWEALFVRILGEEDGQLISAILLGTREGMEEETKDLYRQSGIIHILSISAMHISFIGIMVQRALQKLKISFAVSVGVTSVILGIYVVFVGAPISAVRALIMYLVSVGAVLSKRIYDGMTSLALAAACITLWKPLALFDAGFLLSFGAIIGIVIILPLLRELFMIKVRLVSGVYAGVAVHLSLFPLLLYYYYEFYTYSLLVNFLVVPIIGLAMVSALLGSAIWIIWPVLGEQIFRGCQTLLSLNEAICKIAVAWPCSDIVIGQPKEWNIGLYYILLYVSYLMGYKIMQKIWSKRIAFILGIVVAHLCLCTRTTNNQELEIVVIDVGQGDGIFIRSPAGKTFLIDGGSSDIENVGRYRIEPFLKSQGVGKIDYVLISHGDTDHLSGIKEMLQRQDYGVVIENLLVPNTQVHDEELRGLIKVAQETGVDVYILDEGECIKEGEFSLTCLQPGESYIGEVGNAASMVLELKYKEFDMLFTGDAEGNGERLLMEKLKIDGYEVLKVAHHGSKNSTANDFLDIVNPTYAVISSGIRNRYGHPHPDTIERLENHTEKIYQTNEAGAIIIRTDGKEMRMVTWEK